MGRGWWVQREGRRGDENPILCTQHADFACTYGTEHLEGQ
jgi:hypothetical protein